MSRLLFWPTITFFYPVGNTSAVCLTENLAPESKADVLLLACGDPRHILYTIYAEETNPLTRLRTFDITCCDVDVAILARNALLFTLLADDGVQGRLNNLWNLFYHMFVDEVSLSILFEQCRKLVALAESPETWASGPYSRFLTTCDAATLCGLRRMWTAYLNVATFSSQQADRFEQSFIDGMEDMLQKKRGVTTAGRSAGPLALHANEAVSRQFSSYWSFGTTDDGARGHGQKQQRKVNPTFAFSLHGDDFAVHYATDPLCGFHLAEAFTSGKFTRPHEPIAPHEVVRVAKEQFSHWCTSVSKRLKDTNPSSPTFVIRMFAGDALRFCQALKYCEVTGSPVTPYCVAAWQLSTITLDSHFYGHNAALVAPLSFNIIDTSNISDHVALVNLLVVTAPLLYKAPSATLYTEALLRKGENSSQADLEHICGDLPTMSLLLGLIPSTFTSQFTTRSNAYENLATSASEKPYHERLAWKVIGFRGSGTQRSVNDFSTPPQRLFFSPGDLANFLFHVYTQMFSNEDAESRFQQLSFSSFQGLLPTPRRSGILHYNRRSFCLLVHFVKTRIQTDWARAMVRFEDLVKTDKQLMMNQRGYQELCCQLHLLGVYTTEWMSVPALRHLRLEYEGGASSVNVGLFHEWTESCIPQVVTLVLVVPRDAIATLEFDFGRIGTPMLQCDMQEGPRVNWFAVMSATFGSLLVSGTGEHRKAVVIEGNADQDVDSDALVPGMQPPWRTWAPMIIMFSVPSSLVMDFGRNQEATVGLTLRATPRVAASLMDRLGSELTVFRTKLRDAKRVFVLAQAPVASAGVSAGTGSLGADAEIPNHWQESPRGSISSDQADSNPAMSPSQGTRADVQMNDTFSTIRSFTIRIDVTNPEAGAALADKQTIPTLNSSTGSTRSLDAYVRIGEYHFSLRFPLPVDIVRARLRIARRSSYIEVVAPFASFSVRSARDLSNRFAALSLDPNDDGIPTLGSIHRLNLDRCPTFKLLQGSSESDWFDLHVRRMFSELEEERALLSQIKLPEISNSTSDLEPDTFLHVKQTLQLLLRSAASAMRDGRSPIKAFVLCDKSRREVPYLYIIVARMCLDVGSHTVVADTFVALGTPAVRAVLGTTQHDSYMTTAGPRESDDAGTQHIVTDADETAAWFLLLPRLTERCRAWSHKTNCAYRILQPPEQKPCEQSPGMQRCRSSLCMCGLGMGTKILPKAFARVAPYLTRAAFSPLISVPYLEEADAPMDDQFMDIGMGWPWEATMHRTPLHEKNADIGKTDAVWVGHRCRSCGEEGGQMCSRCKHVRYCSKACQRADWKDHKKNCRDVTEAVCSSNRPA